MTRIRNMSNRTIKLSSTIEYFNYELDPGSTLRTQGFPKYMINDLIKLGDQVQVETDDFSIKSRYPNINWK